MTVPASISDVLETVGRELHRAGTAALVVGAPEQLPSAEILFETGTAEIAYQALDEAAWRWRAGGETSQRRSRRRRYTFDGGFVLTAHELLPIAPAPSGVARPLLDELWARAHTAGDGLRRPDSEPLLVYLAIQVARGALQAPAQLDELRAHAERVERWGDVWGLARRLGVDDTLVGTLDREAVGRDSGRRPVAGTLCRYGWRGARVARRWRRARAISEALLGEPWRTAVTRCRFDGLELLAGPGVFLPRRVSEPTPELAVTRLAGLDDPIVVDVGTGCGAIAVAVARRHPAARVLGFDLDPTAIAWADRNARELGVNVGFAPGSLLDGLPGDLSGGVAMVIANVPCVPAAEFSGASDAAVQAYVGEDRDGLGLQRRLAEQALVHLRRGGWLLVQLAPTQWPAYRQALVRLGYEIDGAHGNDVAVVVSARKA